MVKLGSLLPWRRRAAREAREASEREVMASLQRSLKVPETYGGQLGALIGVGLVFLTQGRRRKAPWYERLNRRVKRYVPLWTVIAAVATIAGVLVALL